MASYTDMFENTQIKHTRPLATHKDGGCVILTLFQERLVIGWRLSVTLKGTSAMDQHDLNADVHI